MGIYESRRNGLINRTYVKYNDLEIHKFMLNFVMII